MILGVCAFPRRSRTAGRERARPAPSDGESRDLWSGRGRDRVRTSVRPGDRRDRRGASARCSRTAGRERARVVPMDGEFRDLRVVGVASEFERPFEREIEKTDVGDVKTGRLSPPERRNVRRRD